MQKGLQQQKSFEESNQILVANYMKKINLAKNYRFLAKSNLLFRKTNLQKKFCINICK